MLDTPVDEALGLFEHHRTLRGILQTLVDVGLGYIALGQPATTLSGGEAQRIKLSRELAKRDTGSTLYLLDEPTTGLHFGDVRKLLERARPPGRSPATPCSSSSTTSTSSRPPTGSSTSAPKAAPRGGEIDRRRHARGGRRAWPARTPASSCAPLLGIRRARATTAA